MPRDIQAFINAKLEEKLSPRTVQYLHAIIRRALNVGMKWGLVARNVAVLADAPRVKRKEVPILSPEQARLFLDTTREDRLHALYVVALTLGLRQGEALGLRWRDVDLEASKLKVNVGLRRAFGERELADLKTERSRRSFVLPAVVIAALREHRLRQVQERLAAGEEWKESGLVFTTTRGGSLDGSTVSHRFQALLARAGLPRFRFYDMRHSAASFLLGQGVDLRIIMEVLGHSQISLTANLYTHVLPVLKQDVADKMDALLGGKE